MDKRIGAQLYTIRDFMKTIEDFDASCKKINDIAGLSSYIENNCAYGCRWFQIKKKK